MEDVEAVPAVELKTEAAGQELQGPLFEERHVLTGGEAVVPPVPVGNRRREQLGGQDCDRRTGSAQRLPQEPDRVDGVLQDLDRRNRCAPFLTELEAARQQV